MEAKELFEQRASRFTVINSNSYISTKAPQANNYVADWSESSQMAYLLIRLFDYSGQFKGRPIIVAGSSSAEDYGVTVGDELLLIDDGNRTTKFGRGRDAKLIAVANDSDAIKTFPNGNYKLYVIK